MPKDSQTYVDLNLWLNGAKEVKQHNELISAVKSLQSFIDPNAYRATYDNVQHAVEHESMVALDSELGRKIKEASDAMTRKLLEESRK